MAPSLPGMRAESPAGLLLKGSIPSLVWPVLSRREGLSASGTSSCSGSLHCQQSHSVPLPFPLHFPWNPVTPSPVSSSDVPTRFCAP